MSAITITARPMTNARLENGRRSTSGSATRPWRTTSATRQPTPTASATAAIAKPPENTVDRPYSRPTSARLIRQVEATSSRGLVSSAAFGTTAADSTAAASTMTANTANSWCQSPTDSTSPATIGPNAGPSVVMALTTPMYVPGLPFGATASVRFMPMGTIMPVPSACTTRPASSAAKLPATSPIRVPASSSASATIVRRFVGTLR